MGWIAGADGCKAGWIVAIAPMDDISTPDVTIVTDLVSIFDRTEGLKALAVDMPIGLPDRIEGAGRAPEVLVRPLLGARQSSVFSIPSRAAVWAQDYREACRLASETSMPPRKVSKQGFNIFDKIRAVDLMLRTRRELVGLVHESHPEVVFQALNGGKPLAVPKKVKSRPHPEGLELRRDLLARAGIGPATSAQEPPRGAGADDLIDALACLICARAIVTGKSRSFPCPPLRDAHGLPIAIWAPVPHKGG